MYTILTPIIVLFLIVGSGIFGTSLAAAETPLIVQLKGKAVGATQPIPPIEATGTREGNCFNVDMIDIRNEERLGTAVRCYTDVHNGQNSLALTETTFLQFPEGKLVARQRVMFQPVGDGASPMTHITGTVPVPSATNLLPEAGTAKYKGVSGRMRLGGVVDLRNFQDKNEMAFDDIAIVYFTDNTASIKQAQRRLREEEFYTGPIDGIAGPRTTAALQQYQAKHGLPATGELDAATRKALAVH